MRPSETLSKRLVDARAEQGLRQSDVAQRATELGHPLDRGTVAKIERGERRVTVDDAAAFAEVLGVPLGYLLGAEEETTEEEGVELHFEVTVKLLPSKEEKSPIEEIFENPRFAKFANLPEFQRVREEHSASIQASREKAEERARKAKEAREDRPPAQRLKFGPSRIPKTVQSKRRTKQ